MSTFRYHDRVHLHQVCDDATRTDVLAFHSRTNFVRRSRFGHDFKFVADGPHDRFRERDHAFLPADVDLISLPRSAGLAQLRRSGSCREFAAGHQVDWSLLGKLLMESFAPADDLSYRRPYASAGAIYPIRVVVGVRLSRFQGAEGIRHSGFHFRPQKAALEPLCDVPEAKLFSTIFDVPESDFSSEDSNPSFILLYCMCIDSSLARYRHRGYRFSMLEAGMMCQQAELVARALGLRNYLYGGVADNEVAMLFNLNPATVAPLVVQAFGIANS